MGLFSLLDSLPHAAPSGLSGLSRAPLPPTSFSGRFPLLLLLLELTVPLLRTKISPPELLFHYNTAPPPLENV